MRNATIDDLKPFPKETVELEWDLATDKYSDRFGDQRLIEKMEEWLSINMGKEYIISNKQNFTLCKSCGNPLTLPDEIKYGLCRGHTKEDLE